SAGGQRDDLRASAAQGWQGDAAALLPAHLRLHHRRFTKVVQGRLGQIAAPAQGGGRRLRRQAIKKTRQLNYGAIFVPTVSPCSTRAMLPGFFRLNTTSGILRSISSVTAVRSITRSWSRCTCW